MQIKGDQNTSRAMNRWLILNLLRRDGPKSRSQIADITGLSPAAVTFVIGDLLAEGHVLEGKAVAGTAGRRPVPIEVNYANGLAIGFKLMVGSAECVVTDLAINPLASTRLSLPEMAPESVAMSLAAAVPGLVAAAGRPNARLAGIGVALPGVINGDQTTCVRSNRFGWNDVPLATMVSRAAGAPTWLEDDTNAYAIAQQLFGFGRRHRDIAVLAVGVGISCALVFEGKLHRGFNGAAGKLGHVLHVENGRFCECGKRGCLMAYHSEAAMLRDWREATGRDENSGLSEMVAALKSGEPAARQIVSDAGSGIGRHLARLVNVMDPEVIVVGGEAVSFGDGFLGVLEETVALHTFRKPPALLPDWNDDSWARGAAALVAQRTFEFGSSGEFHLPRRMGMQ